MSDRFGACVAFVLKHEGGFVNHPSDPGGATNMGITRATLAAWRREPVSVEDVQALTETEASAIYRSAYWNSVRGDELPPGVDLAVFDAAVNSGRRRSIQWLQQAVDVRADGAFGPITMAAVHRASGAHPSALAERVIAIRMEFLRSLATWPVFGRGWLRRVMDLRIAVQAAGGGR